MHPQLDAALTAGRGVIARRDHPRLRAAIDRAASAGGVVRLLPGVHARASEGTDLATRARAACVADPGAVVTGRAAAVLAGRDDVAAPTTITVASPRARGAVPGYRFERRKIDPSLVRRSDGVRFTTKALTALDLAVELGEEQLYVALRGGVEPADLRRALELCPNRRGYGPLRRTVHELRDRPWSPLECAAHDLLRDAGVTGWLANRAVHDERGEERLGYGDLVFHALGLVIELDGASFHFGAEALSHDSSRDLAFERAGWEVIRLGGSLVTDEPKRFVLIVRDILRTREWRRGRRSGRRPRV